MIYDMKFHPEALDRITQALLLASFVVTLNSSEDSADSGNVSLYAIIVSKTNQFQLVEQYLDVGLLFHHVAQVMVDTKELLVIGSIGTCSKKIVRRYAHFIYEMNLQ